MAIIQIIIGVIWLMVFVYIIPIYLYIITHPILIIPVFLCIIVIAWLAFWYTRKKRIEYYRAIQRFDEIMKLDWREFEEFVEEMLRQKGFDTILWRWIKDNWVDVTAILWDKSFHVQCKKFQENKVTAPMIRQLNWVVSDTGKFDGKIFVTTSGFTADAVSEAKKSGMELWDKNYIIDYLKLSNTEFNK